MYIDLIHKKDYTFLDDFLNGMMEYKMKKVGLNNSHFEKIPK